MKTSLADENYNEYKRQQIKYFLEHSQSRFISNLVIKSVYCRRCMVTGVSFYADMAQVPYNKIVESRGAFYERIEAVSADPRRRWAAIRNVTESREVCSNPHRWTVYQRR